MPYAPDTFTHDAYHAQSATPIPREGCLQLWNYTLAVALIATVAICLKYRSKVEQRWKLIKRQQADDVQALGSISETAVKHILGQVEIPDLERVHWLNSLVEQTWPHVNRVVSPILQQKLEALISMNAPPWLSSAHLKRFNLGYNAPQVHGIRVYPVAAADGDRLTVELEMEWHSLADVALTASIATEKYLFKPVGSLVNLLARMLPVTVGVKSVTLSGRFCIMIGPLLNQMPIVTFSKAGLVEKPYLHIELVLFGASCTYFWAPLQTWINRLIGNALEAFIIPESENMPVVPDDFKQIHRPCGLLFVTDLSATNVPKMDYFSESDPYVKLFVLDKGQAIAKDSNCQKTSVKQDDPDPFWDEEFRLPVFHTDQELKLQMWDSDLGSPDDEIGQGSFELQGLLSGTAREVQVEINFVQGATAVSTDRPSAADASNPIKKRNGKPCIVSCKLTYHAFSQHGEPPASPTDAYLSSITSSSSGASPVANDQGRQGPERRLPQDDAIHASTSPFARQQEASKTGLDAEQRVFSQVGRATATRSRSWGCSVPWLRRSSSMERNPPAPKRSWRKTMSIALPVGRNPAHNQAGLYRSSSQQENLLSTGSGIDSEGNKNPLDIERAIYDTARSLEVNQKPGQRDLRRLESAASANGRSRPLSPSTGQQGQSSWGLARRPSIEGAARNPSTKGSSKGSSMEGHFQHSFNEGSSRQLSTEGSLDRSQSDFAGLGQCSPVLMPGAGQTVFQGGVLYVKVRRVSRLVDPYRGKRDHTVEKILPQRMTVKVTVAGETKTAVVATDKNAPEDQILHFVVRHKEQVGSIELMVQDVRLGELQGYVSIPFAMVVQKKRIRDEYAVQGGPNCQLKLSLSLAWSGSH